MNRDDLPIAVSEQTWQIFEDVQKIQELFLEFDLERREGTVSENVLAQFSVLPSEFKIGITIYTKNITEEILTHEVLHARRIIQGYPFFYRVSFPETKTMSNLSNDIEHISVYETLEKMGFDPRPESLKEWKKGIEILRTNLDRIPQDAPSHVLDVIGASCTFGGLIRNLDIKEIEKIIPKRIKKGVSSGLKIHDELSKYNLSNKEDNFNALISVACILKLTLKDVVIGKLDFESRRRLYYNPNDGSLVDIK